EVLWLTKDLLLLCQVLPSTVTASLWCVLWSRFDLSGNDRKRVGGREGGGFICISEALACVPLSSHLLAVILITGQCHPQREETQSQKQNSRLESGF
uniref:Uncharacterized protein n=1 Tax=Balaenoptera musculus TaxID=9771 RepID=A0A8C0HTY6_BALMU